MADHTESSGTGIRPYRTPYGAFYTRGFPESTGSTFASGHLVELESAQSTDAHRVTQASSLSTAYLGVAADPASSVQDTMIPVFMADPVNEFIGWFKGTLASSLLTGHSTGYVSIAHDSTRNIDYVAQNSTAANQRVQITQIGISDIAGGPYNIGDTNGYVAFRFLNEFTAFGKST